MGIRAQKSFPKSPAEGLALGRGVWVRVHIAGALETGPDWQHRHGPPICNYIIENLMLECPTWYPTRPKVHCTLPRVSSVAFRNKARHAGCPVRCHFLKSWVFSSLVDDLADGLNCTHYTSSPHPRPTDWDQAPAPPDLTSLRSHLGTSSRPCSLTRPGSDRHARRACRCRGAGQPMHRPLHRRSQLP